jgi:hypothetical protein
MQHWRKEVMFVWCVIVGRAITVVVANSASTVKLHHDTIILPYEVSLIPLVRTSLCVCVYEREVLL